MRQKERTILMNKSELIAAVAKKTGLKNTETTKALDAALEVIKKTVAKGEEVRLIGFGTFSCVERAARQARNPRTGATLKIAAKKAPKFKAGKEFKDTVK